MCRFSPAGTVCCNNLQNVGATIYKTVLQQPTKIFGNVLQKGLAKNSPERIISFDGFVSYEGRRFGVPCWYAGKTCRVRRDGYVLEIYADDMSRLLTTHDVTWGRRDSWCKDQYASVQPEESPSAPIKVKIQQLDAPESDDCFSRFNFEEGLADE